MAGVVEGLHAAEVGTEEEVMIEGDMALLGVAIVEGIVVGPEDTHRIKSSRSHRPWEFRSWTSSEFSLELTRCDDGFQLINCVLQRHRVDLSRSSRHVLRSWGIVDLRFLYHTCDTRDSECKCIG